jgi:ATP-binding cassette subfamily B protein
MSRGKRGHGRGDAGTAFMEIENSSHKKTLKKLIPYLWPKGEGELKLRVVAAMLFLLGAKLVTVYLAFFYKDAVDALTLVKNDDGNTVPLEIAIPIMAIVSYGFARFMSIGFAELRDVTFVKVSQHALRTLALKTFKHMHSLSLKFHLDRRTGGLSRAIERGTRAIDFILRFMLFSVLPTIMEIILVAVIFYNYFGPAYAAALLIAVVSYVTLTFFVTDWRLKFRRTMNEEDSRANTKAIDSLLNYETVKYFNNEELEASRYNSALTNYQKAAVKSQYSLGLLNTGQSLVINTCLVVAMVFAAVDVMSGKLTLGDFVLANTLLIQLFIPLNMLGFVYREIKNSLVDMEQMFALIEQAPEVEDKENALDLDAGQGDISFENVSFSYNPNRTILNNISFKVPAGKTVAVVGPSGAGKSTLARILFRFYDIKSGVVKINDQDIAAVRQDSLRRAIAIVPQDTVLFNDSIYYNIQYGRDDASHDEVIKAAKLAQADSFVAKLPEGYDTMVGERGLKLSGGEKQRVALARTILKAPPILILDEATSALDTGTEREIQAALNSVTQGRTTLVIAHRLSTIIDADEIIVLDDGEIVEQGSHDFLLDAKGMYYTMWSRQLEAQQMADKLKDLAKDKLVGEDVAQMVLSRYED